jgi:predicted TPR repeat methyltransferase
MPYSLKGGKEQTAAWFRENAGSINRVLDIGPGSGTYARLIKQQHGLAQTAHWTGVEIWKPYIERYQLDQLYDRIVNQDARYLDWQQLGDFDVTVAGDVLEHMTKSEAQALVSNILQHSRTLIVSIPICHMPQDDHAYDNPHEAHVKDDWSHDEVMETWGHNITTFWRKSVKSKLAVYWMQRA